MRIRCRLTEWARGGELMLSRLQRWVANGNKDLAGRIGAGASIPNFVSHGSYCVESFSPANIIQIQLDRSGSQSCHVRHLHPKNLSHGKTSFIRGHGCMDGYGFIGERHCLREQDSGHKQRKHFHGLTVYQILVGEELL